MKQKKETISKRIFNSMFKTGTLTAFTLVGAGFVDSVIISRFLGIDAVATAGLAYPLYSVAGIVYGCIGTGFKSMASQRIVRSDMEGFQRIYSVSILLSVLISVILINGRSADIVNDAGTTATLAFPKTESCPVKLTDYERPAELIEVPHGSSRDVVKYEYLPQTLPITVDDGSFTEASVIWNSIEPDPDPYPATLDEIVCAVEGHLSLPFGVDSNGIDTSFSVQVIVKEADHCAAPAASVPSGAYPTAIDVILSTETPDAAIWYTTNGLPPGLTETHEYEEPIHITPDMVNEQGEFVIRAYAWKNKMNDSPESVFVYTFTDRIVPPEGDMLAYRGEPQIGVKASPFYTLIAPDGSEVVIDNEGNATATNAGVYTVTARIADGYVWKIGETEPQAVPGAPDENGTVPVEWITEDITTEEDQTITFTIEKASLEDAIVTAKDMVYTGEPLTPEVTVSLGDAPIPPAEYSVTFENNIEIGTATILITGSEINYTGTATGTFEILGASEPKFATHNLVLSGQIGVNFYMELPAIDGVDWSTSYMTFTIPHGTVTARDDFDPTAMNRKATYYSFTAYVNSIQMAEPITATFHWTEGEEEKTIGNTYAVRDYLIGFDAALAEDPDAYDELTIDLVHALADYGHYVQAFLADARGWTLGEDYAEMDRFYATGYDIEAIKTALSGYAIGIEVNGADFTKFTFTTVLDSATTIRMQFTVPKGYSGAFNAETSDGTPVTVRKTGTRYTAEIADIPAHNLGKTFEVTITTGNGSATMNLSALSYVKIAFDAFTDANAKNAMAAIYTYAKAAEAFKSGN